MLHIDTVVILAGYADTLCTYSSIPTMAYNNTYGMQLVNETTWRNMTDSYERPGGCFDQVNECRAAAAVSDPYNLGVNETVNRMCEDASLFCADAILTPAAGDDGDNVYDISDVSPQIEPFLLGYLNQRHVQEAIGVPLNYTPFCPHVAKAFGQIGDDARDGVLDDLAYLLDNGVKFALMYGDRDLICNW